MQANAANQKTVDDIDAVIKSLEKQLDAQVERLEQGNRGVNDQSLSIELQIAQLDDLLQKSIIRSPISGIVLTKYAEAGEFAKGSMLPKVESCIQFIEDNPQGVAIISELCEGLSALNGKSGTRIIK